MVHIFVIPLQRQKGKTTSFDNKKLGEVAEWSIAPVLKTDVPRGTGGSNPSLSAENESSNKEILNYQLVKDFFFYTMYSSNDGFDVIICDQFGFQFATISTTNDAKDEYE